MTKKTYQYTAYATIKILYLLEFIRLLYAHARPG